jgi:hypothetical protein
MSTNEEKRNTLEWVWKQRKTITLTTTPHNIAESTNEVSSKILEKLKRKTYANRIDTTTNSVSNSKIVQIGRTLTEMYR